MSDLFPPEIINQLLASVTISRFTDRPLGSGRFREAATAYERKPWPPESIRSGWTTTYHRTLPHSDAAIASYFLYLNRWKDEETAALVEPHYNESDNEYWRRTITLGWLAEFEIRTPLILEILHTSRSGDEAAWRIERMYAVTADQLTSVTDEVL